MSIEPNHCKQESVNMALVPRQTTRLSQ